MNKFGLKREDFASYEDYRREYKRLHQQSYASKLVQTKYRKSEKGRGIRAAAQAKYRAGKACPPWADLDAITEIYKNCPLGKQVDHDYALKGENFSGLHIPENLQYLTPSENRSKGNKHV